MKILYFESVCNSASFGVLIEQQCHIFGISVKNCIVSGSFWKKYFLEKNRPVGDHDGIFGKKTAEGDQRPIFLKNFFSKNYLTRCSFLR